MWLGRLGSLALIVSLGACIPPVPTPKPENNSPPIPGLRTPVIAGVGAGVGLDASATCDPEGDRLTYAFEFFGYAGAGESPEPIHTLDPVAEVIFPAAGLYTVQLTVTDFLGAEGILTQDITVREEFPLAPNFCDTVDDCPLGDTCEDQLCYNDERPADEDVNDCQTEP